MEKSHGIKGLVLLLFLLSACSPVVKFDSGAEFKVELAETPEQKAKGLMHREFLPVNQGMLFIFDNEKPRTFWMKNTLIPLDMVFINSNLNVVDIKQAVPCTKEPCELYQSAPAQYVLEVNSGIAEEKEIKIGSKMELTQ